MRDFMLIVNSISIFTNGLVAFVLPNPTWPGLAGFFCGASLIVVMHILFELQPTTR